MSQSIYSRVRVSRAERRRLEREATRRLEAERRRREEQRRREEAARRQQLEAERRAAAMRESERLAHERLILSPARPDRAAPAGGLARDEIDEQLIALRSRADIVAAEGAAVAGADLARQARTLSHLLGQALALDESDSADSERERLSAPVAELWQTFTERAALAEEQRFVIDNVTAVLDGLGYHVVGGEKRPHEDPASPVYIDFASPTVPEVQLSFTQAGQLIAEVSPNDVEDPSALAEQTAHWCSDYEVLAHRLAERGIECDTRMRRDGVAPLAESQQSSEKKDMGRGK